MGFDSKAIGFPQVAVTFTPFRTNPVNGCHFPSVNFHAAKVKLPPFALFSKECLQMSMKKPSKQSQGSIILQLVSRKNIPVKFITKSQPSFLLDPDFLRWFLLPICCCCCCCFCFGLTDRPTITRGSAMGNEIFYWDCLWRLKSTFWFHGLNCLTIFWNIVSYDIRNRECRLRQQTQVGITPGGSTLDQFSGRDVPLGLLIPLPYTRPCSAAFCSPM